MSRYFLAFCVALSFVLNGVILAHATSYVYVPFDDPGATAGTAHPRGINNAGFVSGWELSGGASIGFVRTPAGTFQQIGGGEIGTRINGINNTNVVVGTFIQNSGLQAVQLAAPYSSSAGVGISPGLASQSEAFGINDRAPLNQQIGGTLTLASNGTVTGFVTPSAFTTVFPGPSGILSMQVFGLSNKDNGLRYVGTYETSPGVFQGFYQTSSDASSSVLITVAGASRTDAFGIQYDQAGTFTFPAVVGRYTLGGVDHGLLLTNGVASLETIDIAGALGTRLYGVNDLGQIVGEIQANSTHGFYLTPFADDDLATLEGCLGNPALCASQILGGFIGDSQSPDAIPCQNTPANTALCTAVTNILALLQGPNAPPVSSFFVESVNGVVAAVPQAPGLLLVASSGLGILAYRWRSNRRAR